VKFARIEMLYLIWMVPALFVIYAYGIHRRSSILSRYFSTSRLESMSPELRTARRWIKCGFFLVCVLFMALSMSGPRYGYRWQEVERKGIDIVIAVDCSRSMLAPDIKPTRLDRAKREIHDLLTMLQGDRIGLVAFAGTAFLQCPLTIDYDSFHIFLRALSPDFLPVGGTDLAGAIRTAVSSFNKEINSEKAVIIITDGENTGDEDPVQAAQTASKAGVRLFSIGVGKTGGVPVSSKDGGFIKDGSGKIVLTKLDEETLKKLAEVSGGTFVKSVAGDMDLDLIYTQEIRGKMEKTVLLSGRKKVFENRYQWFLSLAVMMLILEILLPTSAGTAGTMKRKLPILCLAFFLFSITDSDASGMDEGYKAYKSGEYESALKFFIDEQLENPEKPEIFYNIGNTYYKMGDYDSALKSYKKALESKNAPLKQKSLFNMGNANYRRGKLEEAVRDYQEALKIDPDDIEARQNIEFAKKMMEKQREKKDQQGNEEQNGGKEKKSDNGSGNKEDQKGMENKPSNHPDKREENKGEKEKNSGPAKRDINDGGTSPTEPPDVNPAGDEKEAGAEDADKLDKSSNREGLKTRAERILNRLKDKPGGAMIPAYGEKRVEKDW